MCWVYCQLCRKILLRSNFVGNVPVCPLRYSILYKVGCNAVLPLARSFIISVVQYSAFSAVQCTVYSTRYNKIHQYTILPLSPVSLSLSQSLRSHPSQRRRGTSHRTFALLSNKQSMSESQPAKAAWLLELQTAEHFSSDPA
jgi:hypothetical protein